MNTEIFQNDQLNADRLPHIKRGRLLEYFTLVWNLLEAVISIGAGIVAGSIALVGFGSDSLIECLSGSILLWRLSDVEKGERREKMALTLIGITFLFLAPYIAVDAVKDLYYQETPKASIVGIGIALLSLMVMPILAHYKRQVAAKLNSRAMIADSRQTDICAYLSAILLVGLVLNAVFGWWWADPVAALIMVPIITKEGIDAIRGKTCCDTPDCH